MVSDGFVGADTTKEVGRIVDYREGDEIPTTKFVFLDRAGANGNRQSVAKVECHCSRGVTRVEDIPWQYIQRGRRTECENCRRNVAKLSYLQFAKACGLTADEFYSRNKRIWGFETKNRPTAGQLYGMLLSIELEKMFQPKNVIRAAYFEMLTHNHERSNCETDLLLQVGFNEAGMPEGYFVVAMDAWAHGVGRICFGSYWELRVRTYWALRRIGIDNADLGHPYGENDESTQ